MSLEKKATIRNSTAEFLIVTGQSCKDSIEVRVADESVLSIYAKQNNFFKED